jgi:hypothetical protein
VIDSPYYLSKKKKKKKTEQKTVLKSESYTDMTFGSIIRWAHTEAARQLKVVWNLPFPRARLCE